MYSCRWTHSTRRSRPSKRSRPREANITLIIQVGGEFALVLLVFRTLLRLLLLDAPLDASIVHWLSASAVCLFSSLHILPCCAFRSVDSKYHARPRLIQATPKHKLVRKTKVEYRTCTPKSATRTSQFREMTKEVTNFLTHVRSTPTPSRHAPQMPWTLTYACKSLRS